MELSKPIEYIGRSIRSVAMHIGEVVIDALDCWGDDPLQDQELRSQIWDRQDDAA